MVPFKRFCRQPWWMVFSVVYFILAGTGLAAVSEFRVNTYTDNNQMTPALATAGGRRKGTDRGCLTPVQNR